MQNQQPSIVQAEVVLNLMDDSRKMNSNQPKQLANEIANASPSQTAHQTSNPTADQIANQSLGQLPLGGTMRIESNRPQIQTGTRAFLNVIRSKVDLGAHQLIDGPTLLGRDPNCTFPLHDFSVSKRHAMIRPAGNGTYILQDLQSTNGTRINGTNVPGPRVLQDGEKIFVGDTVIRFALVDEMDVDFHSEVATLVSTDPLTGLPAKMRFDQALEFAIEDAKRNSTELALVMMDMDGVKQINDTHGHLFGAHVISETGRLIARLIENKGQACRFGGDEFSAFFPGHDLAAVTELAELIRGRVETAGFEKDEIPLRPTISIGVATFPNDGDNLLKLTDMADKALYRAKAQGKNQVSH